MKNESIVKSTLVFLTKIITVIGRFLPKHAKVVQIKAASQPKPSDKTQHGSEVHWCCNECHGAAVPRELISRGRTAGGKPFAVFQCSDPNCKSYVAAVVKNGNPDAGCILFRGRNYHSRPERRVPPATPGKKLIPHRNHKPDWSPGESVTGQRAATQQRGPLRYARAAVAMFFLGLTIASASAASDLVVSGSVSVSPTPVTSGNNLTVTLTIRNQGASAATASTTRVQIKNTALTATIADLNFSTPAIAVGSSAAQTYTVAIPVGTTPGSYNAYIVLDRFGTAGQGGNTGNDFGSSPAFNIVAPIQSSDLIVSGNVLTSPNPVTAGNNLSVTLTIHNQGVGVATASTTRVQIKNAALATIADQSFSTPAIAAGGSTTPTYTIPIPAGTTPATCNAYITLDQFSTAGQGGNTGNDYATSAAFNIVAPIQYSDLVISGNVSASPNPVTAGSNLTVTFTIHNQGASAAAVSTTRVQIKNAALATIADQSFSTAVIAAGGSTTPTYTISIPVGTTPATCNAYVTLDQFSTAGQGGNTANDYSTSPVFNVISSTPQPVVSATLSTVTVSPNTVSADGKSAITVVVTLKDSNGNPVSGKTVNVYAGTLPLTFSGATGQTDANGRMTAVATSTAPCSGNIWAIDRTDVLLLQQEASVLFTSAFILPNNDLNQAIGTLYQNTANSLWNSTTPSISSIGAEAGTAGDDFRANFTETQASGVLDAVLGIVTLGASAGDSVEFADLLALPGLEETGTGPLISNSPLASALLDTEMIQNQVSSRVLKSSLLQIAAVAKDESVGKVTDAELQSALQYIAAQPNGLSMIANNNSLNCLTYGEALQQQSQNLIATGIPPLSAADQSKWANDLQLRAGVGTAFTGILSHENDFVNQFSLARQQASEDALKLLLAKFAIEASATVFFDGPGALVIGGIFTIAGENTTLQNMNSDQNGYNAAFSVLGGCVQYSGQAYLNTAAAYTEITQGQTANSATAQVGAMTDWENGYTSWSPLQLESKFSVTKAYSTIEIQNTSGGAATFEVVVLSGYTSSAFGENIPNLSQVSISVTNIPAGTDVQVPVIYYDGQNGGKPDPATPMSVYVLANNVSGTFLAASFTHSWNPSTTSANASSLAMFKSNSMQSTPSDITPNSTNGITDVENPVTSYITQNPTNQNYAAQIFVINPFRHDYAAIVTQEVPPDVTVLSSDGNVQTGTIVWTNTIAAGALAKDMFTFNLSVMPGASTNLPAPVVTFVDQTNNESSILASVMPTFSGAFPVTVNGLVPPGSNGSDAPMPINVTNMTGTTQAGMIAISVVNHAGIEVTNYSQSFSVAGSSDTILNFSLPGGLPSDSYTVSASLTINGGTGQVLAGAYIVSAVPITLGFNATPPLATNGLALKLTGPAGNYLILGTTNLSNASAWQPLMYLSVTNSPLNFIDPDATNYSQRFYRAVTQ